MSEIAILAQEKLAQEVKEFKGDTKARGIYKDVAKTITAFCATEEFAQAVYNSKKTLSDCCKEILSGVSSAISDIEAYKRAVKFYFPGATVHFNMEIHLEDQDKKPEQNKIISLLDLI